MALQRGTVIEKIEALDLAKGVKVYVLRLRAEDDGCCEDLLVVDKKMYDAACVAGLGQDTVIEFGTVLRIVPPASV